MYHTSYVWFHPITLAVTTLWLAVISTVQLISVHHIKTYRFAGIRQTIDTRPLQPTVSLQSCLQLSIMTENNSTIHNRFPCSADHNQDWQPHSGRCPQSALKVMTQQSRDRASFHLRMIYKLKLNWETNYAHWYNNNSSSSFVQNFIDRVIADHSYFTTIHHQFKKATTVKHRATSLDTTCRYNII